MKSIKEADNLNGRKILLRTDLDVPVSKDGKIQDKFRIIKQKETIDYLLNKKAIVFMVAHISAIKSLEGIISQLEATFNHSIKFVRDLNDRGTNLEDGGLYLLDNIRKWDGEENNDVYFAEELASGLDLYVNNAFAVCHRSHASVSAVTKFLPSYAGILLDEEIINLSRAIEYPSEGKIFVMGGAKAATKIPVIKNFIDKSDKILVGGVIANDILVKRGINIDDSKFDEDYEKLLEGLDVYSDKIIMPTDYNIHDGKYLDIGPKSIKSFCDFISQAEMTIWNGPMGLFEDERFALGTNSIAQFIVSNSGIRIIGGGDTVSAVSKLGLIDKFNFVSTGGGAMLAFLAGERLPGLSALNYYE